MTIAQIRREMKMNRDALPIEGQISLSNAIHRKLLEMEQFVNSRYLFTYLSFQSEVDTRAILATVWHENKMDLQENSNVINKKVFVPRVEGKDMDFYEISDLNSLIPSKFGVLEPSLGVICYAGEEHLEEKIYCNPIIRIMLLPGLAFDPSGNRIGYGAGYYDRFLAKFQEDYFLKIALAYDFQILTQINTEEYDIKADIIITPTQIIQCK